MDSFINFATAAAGLLVGFCGLVFVHELGHYLLAKWNGVRVHVFSIGMGPYIISFTKGETVYALSMIPLGGYVKLAGQDDMKPALEASQDPKDYRNKSPGQRAQILAAGAIFNLICAYFLFTLSYYVGVNMPWTRVGEIDPKSPMGQAYEKLGDGTTRPVKFEPGDHILAVNGEEVKSMMEVHLEVASSGSKQEIALTYERPKGGTPKAGENPDYNGKQYAFVKTKEDKDSGGAEIGLKSFLPKKDYRVGFSTNGDHGFRVYRLDDKDNKGKAIYSNGNPAKNAGFQLMDKVMVMDGMELKDSNDFMQKIYATEEKEHDFVLMRDDKEVKIHVKPELIGEGDEKRHRIGIFPISDEITQIDETSEAYKLGLRKGDLILFLAEIEENKRLEIGYVNPATYKALTDEQRNNLKMTKIIVPIGTDPNSIVLSVSTPDFKNIKASSVSEAMAMGYSDLKRHSFAVFRVVHGLVTQKLGIKAVSGPIGIGTAISQVASKTNLMYYIWFMAFISVNLGMMQFMPIPLLDGFHLLLVLVEKIKGTPVSPNLQEKFQYVGLALLLSLLVFATKNDIMRMFS